MVVLLTLAVTALSVTGGLSDAVELGILVAAVGLLGLPHGALDHLAGRVALRPTFGRVWMVPFGIAYLGLATLVVAGWIVAPVASLALFLVVSAGHFGVGDVRKPLALGAETRWATLGRAVEAAARAALIFIPLFCLHTEEVSALFASLTPISDGELTDTIAAVGPGALAVSGSLLAVVLAHHLGGWALGSADHGRLVLEVVVLGMLFCFARPLVAFVVYFCFWHAFRHSLDLAADLDASSPRAALRAFVRHAWPNTLAALAMAVGGYALVAERASGEAIIQVVFVGLSALTAPHILFSWLARRTQSKVSAATPLGFRGTVGALAQRDAS